jgi:hypothetical protein
LEDKSAGIFETNKEDNKSKITAYNRSVYATPAYGGLGLHSARSVACGSFPRLIAAHFASPGLCCAKPLSGLAKRRKQPERYVPFALKFL